MKIPNGEQGWEKNVPHKRLWGSRGKKNRHRDRDGNLKPDREFCVAISTLHVCFSNLLNYLFSSP